MNIWEIEPQFKCPIVGAMLTVEKHKQILEKCGYAVSRSKPYEFHQLIMSKLHEQNNVSTKVNNFIRNQAAKQMKKIAGLGEEQIRTLWAQNLKKNHAGPMMYAIISHEDTGPELLLDIIGEVHMQAHANMNEIFTVRKQQLLMADALSAEKKKSASKIQDIRILMTAKKSDARIISQLRSENRSLSRQVSETKTTPQIIQTYEREIADLKDLLFQGENQLREKEREKRALQIQLFESKDENKFLKEGLLALSENSPLSLPKDCSNCSPENCPQYQLCAQRVFMIGGITKMKSFYKDMVENAGGKFDYHDGYLKSGHANLEARVKRCDVVLCPVNCNSHNACLAVKKLCNRYQKPLKILNSSSLSAVSQAIFLSQDRSAHNLSGGVIETQTMRSSN